MSEKMSEKMTKKRISKILKLHKMWLNGESGGERAIFKGVDISYADLSCADLSYADLSYADLSYADLSYANLSYANLSYADLSCADLSYANLSYANLSYADLSKVNLDFSCLPLWYGGKFKTDEEICKQLVAHTLRIMEMSGQGSEKLRSLMSEYKKGWHQEEFF